MTVLLVSEFSLQECHFCGQCLFMYVVHLGFRSVSSNERNLKTSNNGPLCFGCGCKETHRLAMSWALNLFFSMRDSHTPRHGCVISILLTWH